MTEHTHETSDEPAVSETPRDASSAQSAHSAHRDGAAADLGSPNKIGTSWPLQPDEWYRVSPKYAWVIVISNLIAAAIFAAAVVAALVFLPFPAPWAHIGWVIVALQLLNVVLAYRRVKAIGFRLREDDLLFRKGIFFSKLVAVPYGRLQMVEVERGPLLRMMGLAQLEFVTAAAAANVSLPGLPKVEADNVRDHLIRLAESRRSGL